MLEAQVAQQRKWAFDTAEVARTLEVQNVDLRSKLAQQENLNKAQHHSNQALEARVAELEQQLTGVAGRSDRGDWVQAVVQDVQLQLRAVALRACQRPH